MGNVQNNLDRPTDRESNFELLRIVAMLLIVAYHFAVNGGFAFPSDQFSINRFWIRLLLVGGKIGVDIFVLISGYFLVESTHVKTEKLLKLWLEILTYSVIIGTCRMAAGAESVSIKQIKTMLMPVANSTWWFASTYFVFYLISPYVAKLLRSLDKKDYLKALFLTTSLWCFAPTFLNRSYESSNLIWFIYLFGVAGYIRLHLKDKDIKASLYIAGSAALILLTFMSAVCFDVLGVRIPFFAKHATHLYGAQTVTILMISVLMFLGFRKLKLGRIGLINVVSAATFGVYLIHEHSFMRTFLWHTLFKNSSFSESAWLIPYSLLVILIVYLGCTLIELARKRLIEARYLGLLLRAASLFDRFKDRFFSAM